MRFPQGTLMPARAETWAYRALVTTRALHTVQDFVITIPYLLIDWAMRGSRPDSAGGTHGQHVR